MILFGADRIAAFHDCFAGRVALLTAPSGRTSGNLSTIEALKAHCNLTLLLAPEHGVRGDKPAGALFSDERDEDTGLPVLSLYTKASKRLSPQALEAFDTLVYDIADVGCRYYTFISSMLGCIEDCAAAGKRLVVLDRPNPLGDRVEGGILRREAMSFVGCYEMPVCYGLTCGELALMMNEERKLHCELTVVSCQGLTRERTFRDWRKPWVMPSLGIPRFETALLYPGTCLIEGTNCSEGRGTADPFGIIGAPFIHAERFCRAFNDMGLPGVVATPVYFTPTASKHQGRLCGGIQLHIMDETALRPVALGVRMLDLLRTMYPKDFRFLDPVREDGKPFISLLAGHRGFENPDWDANEMLRRYEGESAQFRVRKAPYEIYPKEGIQ